MKERIHKVGNALKRAGQALIDLSKPPEMPAIGDKIEKHTLTSREKEEITSAMMGILEEYGTEARSPSEVASFFEGQFAKGEGIHPTLAQVLDDVVFAYGKHMWGGGKDRMLVPKKEVVDLLKRRLLPEKFDF
jgi:hypothetical protein